MAGRYNYQPLVKHLYKQSHSKLPMDLWVHTIGVTLPLVKPHELYEPVVLRVKTTGRIASPDGTVKHTITPEESGWYQELRLDLAKVAFGMKNPEADAKYLSLRNMENQDIANFSHAQLLVAGEIDVYDTRTGKQLLATERKQPSAHLHSNKLEKLYEWSEDLNQEMAALMASELAGSANIEELELRTQPGSKLYKQLVSLVNNNGKFASLTSTHGANSVARAVPSSVIAERVATAALDQLCAGIEANGSKIIGHFASAVAKVAASAEKNNDRRKPLLQQFRIAAAAPQGASFQSDSQLYAHVAQKALAQGPHTRRLVYMVYKPIESRHHHDGRHDHHNKKKKKADAKEDKKTPESLESEAQQFQLYSGRPVYISPTKSAAPASVKQAGYSVQSALPVGAPVRERARESSAPVMASRLPPLEPIGTPMRGESVASRLPPLEPIGAPMRESVASRLPPLEPIGTPVLPPKFAAAASTAGARPMPALISSVVAPTRVASVATAARVDRPMSVMDILNAMHK